VTDSKKRGIVYFVGAGPGDPELITVKGRQLLANADLVLYAGSLINTALLQIVRKGVSCIDTAGLTLDEMTRITKEGVQAGKLVVRLHSGDPSLYGALQEQLDILEQSGIPYEIVPGVSSLFAAAALLGRELTVPEVSQTVILTRLGNRTPVPEKESLKELSRHQATICIFLSIHLLAQVVDQLKEELPEDTPVAVVARASWPNSQVVSGNLSNIEERVKRKGIERTALIFVGEFLRTKGKASQLYDPDFSHGYRS